MIPQRFCEKPDRAVSCAVLGVGNGLFRGNQRTKTIFFKQLGVFDQPACCGAASH